MTRLTFDIIIAAPRAAVWATMIDPQTYQTWTAPFCEGSRFQGAWDQGAHIQFLGPDDRGMFSEVAEHRPAEYISLRHLGMVENGRIDASSEMASAWVGAYENWRFDEVPEACRLVAEVDTPPAYELYMQEKYPQSLMVLKFICEQPRKELQSNT